MSELFKKLLLGVGTAAVISFIATMTSSHVISKEHAIKIENLQEQMKSCHAQCDAIKRDIYRPSWNNAPG